MVEAQVGGRGTPQSGRAAGTSRSGPCAPGPAGRCSWGRAQMSVMSWGQEGTSCLYGAQTPLPHLPYQL